MPVLRSCRLALPAFPSGYALAAGSARAQEFVPGGNDLYTSGLFAGVGLFCVCLVVLLLVQTSRRNKVDEARREAAAARDALATEVATLRAERDGEVARADSKDAIIWTLPFPVWRRDGDLAIEDSNPAVDSLLSGRPPTQGIADRAIRLGVQQSESRHVVVDGERHLYDFIESPLADGEGTVGFARDVTVLEQLQSELSRHLDAHEVVLEQLSTAIAIFGPDRRLRFHNTAYRRLWQLSSGDLVGTPSLIEILELLRERRRLPEQVDFAAFREQWLRLFSNLVEPREELMFLPDDTTMRMSVMPHPLGGLVLTFEDVTDRLALERSYNTLYAVQRETIDNLYDGVAVFGADGRLKVSNTAFARLWAIPAEAIDDDPHLNKILEIMRPLFPATPTWPERRREILASISRRDGETVRLERPDGKVVDCTYVPLPDGATLMNFRDITDTENVQRALQERNEALETADRLKSEFIASVSYELRTPLNAIIGFSELLGHGYVGNLNDRQKEYAQAIRESSGQLVTLVNDILDLASIEAGYLRLEPTEVDIRDLVESVVGLARERARARLITIDTQIDSDHMSIQGDRLRLRQALFNLLSNAILFTAEGGRVSVTATRADGTLSLAVSDTGSGLVRLGDEQAFPAASGGARGRTSGLGLTLVRRLIELHHGTLDIRVSAEEADVVGGSGMAGGPSGFAVTCRIPEVQPPPVADPPGADRVPGRAE